MARNQLPLDLSYPAALGSESFVVTDANRDAFTWVTRWPDWPSHALSIFGPKGCGKSHLGHLWQEKSGGAQIAHQPEDEVLPKAILLDTPKDWPELALLQLFNRQKEQGGWLLILSEMPPARWDVTLPDLASRLSAIPAIGMAAPDDELLMALMAKLFADRNQTIDEDVLRYVAQHIERSFAAAAEAVATIDRTALARQRQVTMALARELFAKL